ncbi:MAG TPA: BON domain-containing protein, partial [Flavobacteriales bacterium]|nr:BON domain-containing protein [Flavobacteriales bacterium]
MKTDLNIKKDVLDEIAWNPRLKNADISVDVYNGTVTLEGICESYAKKIAAERTAMRVGGVKKIVNNVEVRLPSKIEMNDAALEKNILYTLKWSASVPEETIRVHVRNGWVTIEGNVEFEFQKRAITRIVTDMSGVMGITNSVVIASDAATTFELKDKISVALKRNISSGEKINITVEGDKVILSGKVHSITEWFVAEQVAWAAPGINTVENRLEVSQE